MLSLTQILNRLPGLLEREDLVDMRPDLVRLDEAEHVFVQLFRANIDAAMRHAS